MPAIVLIKKIMIPSIHNYSITESLYRRNPHLITAQHLLRKRKEKKKKTEILKSVREKRKRKQETQPMSTNKVQIQTPSSSSSSSFSTKKIFVLFQLPLQKANQKEFKKKKKTPWRT